MSVNPGDMPRHKQMEKLSQVLRSSSVFHLTPQSSNLYSWPIFKETKLK